MTTVPEGARAGLLDLHQKAARAQRDLDVATNTVMAMLGLDPTLNHKLDLDTGVVTPADTTEDKS